MRGSLGKHLTWCETGGFCRKSSISHSDRNREQSSGVLQKNLSFHSDCEAKASGNRIWRAGIGLQTKPIRMMTVTLRQIAI